MPPPSSHLTARHLLRLQMCDELLYEKRHNGRISFIVGQIKAKTQVLDGTCIAVAGGQGSQTLHLNHTLT